TAPLMLGTTIDIESDGAASVAADGDDDAGIDDEDGVAEPISLPAGAPATVTISVTNNTDEVATLAGWIDLDQSGTFDPSERRTLEVPAGTGTADYPLEFAAATTPTDTYARFRLFPGTFADPADILPTGPA